LTLDNGEYRGTIADFGLSRWLQDAVKGVEAQEFGTLLPLKWMAPDAIVNSTYSIYSDVFMFGMFLYEMVAREGPRPDISILDFGRMTTDQLMSLRVDIPGNFPVDIASLIYDCCATDRPRPNMHQVNQRLIKTFQKCRALKPRDVRTVFNIQDVRPVSVSQRLVEVSQYYILYSFPPSSGKIAPGPVIKPLHYDVLEPASASSVMCMECEKAPASMRCDTCEQCLCGSCSFDLHRTGKRAQHELHVL